jgi:large subunit ribosomal protein L14
MLQKGSYIKIGDNCGGAIAKCIRVPGSYNKNVATLGSQIKINIVKLRTRKKVQKKKIYNGVLVAIKQTKRRKDGSFIKFKNNKVLVLSETKKFLGTRIKGLICKEIRGGINEMRYKKIISCAENTV